LAIEFESKVKALDEYAEILKHELLFSMAEGKPENMTRIITLKRELDKAAQEKMRLSKIHHSTINKGIALTVPIG
jgi:hypothetical protein